MKLVTQHLHIMEEQVRDTAKRLDLAKDEAHSLLLALLDVEVQVDVETGRIMVVEGHPLEDLT